MKHYVIYEYICFLPCTKIQFSPQAAGNLPKEIKPDISTDDSNSVEIILPDPYITIEPGTYPIKEFIKLLKEDNVNGHNSNGDFPPYDFHEDEEGHEGSIEKAKKYRLDNADKRNARNKELRKTRKMQRE